MSVWTCNNCGGLRASPGEMFGGKACQCSHGEIGYTCSWPERIEEQRRYGYLVGAIQGLRYRVDDETKKVIDDVLRKVGDTTPKGRLQRIYE